MSARYSNLWNICHTSRHYFRPVYDFQMSSHEKIESALFRMDFNRISLRIVSGIVDQIICVLCSKDMTQFLEFSPAEIASCEREVNRTGKTWYCRRVCRSDCERSCKTPLRCGNTLLISLYRSPSCCFFKAFATDGALMKHFEHLSFNWTSGYCTVHIYCKNVGQWHQLILVDYNFLRLFSWLQFPQTFRNLYWSEGGWYSAITQVLSKFVKTCVDLKSLD